MAFYPLELSIFVFENTFVRALPQTVEEATAYHCKDPIRTIISVFFTDNE